MRKTARQLLEENTLLQLRLAEMETQLSDVRKHAGIDVTDPSFTKLKQNETALLRSQEALQIRSIELGKINKKLSSSNSNMLVRLNKMEAYNLSLQRTYRELMNEIEERKKIEKELRESEEFIKRMVASSKDCIKVLDLDGNLLSMNEGGLETMELDDIECYLNSPWPEFWSGASRAEAMNAVEKAKHGFTAKFSGYCETGKGNLKWWDVVVSPIRDVENTVCRLLSVSRDMTEQKNAEMQIIKAIELYEIISKATSDTIWDCDLVTKTMTYNEGITKVFGYHPDKINNQLSWWEQCIHPDDLYAVKEKINTVFENGIQNVQLNYRFRCLNGSYKYIFDRTFVLFDDKGIPYRMIGAMQDISFQREEELVISKKIINAQEEERYMLGMELHDNINQILAGTLITVNLVKQKITEKEKAIELLDKSTHYIDMALNEIRKLSHQLAPDTFESNSLKQLVEKLLLSINENNSYHLHLDFADLTHIQLNGQIQKNLYRIIQEQVKNIVKYAMATKISVTLAVHEDCIRLQICDNGKGFNTRNMKTKGIGLTNIKRRAEAFQGKYSIKSSRGKGCEIIIEIPIENVPEKPSF